MAQIAFGSPEPQAVLKQDRVLRAEAAKEARIKKARREGDETKWEVTIESYRTDFVLACSEEEAWHKAESLVSFDEEVTTVEAA